MDDRDLHRWEVKDSFASDWRALPGEFTAKEIWAMRARGDFWVALPVRDVESAFDTAKKRTA